MTKSSIKELLDKKVAQYNCPTFIAEDPISIPHQFAKLQDIEIIGLWTAILSWGQRKTILNKAKELCEIMDHSPHDFILNHNDHDLRRIEKFKHRTFNATDGLYFIKFFNWYYGQYNSLEDAFCVEKEADTVKDGLINFRKLFTSLPEFPGRTGKHVSSPITNSSCKRINMFLRWMVRKDNRGVDFGLWKKIKPSQLMIPLDVHVYRVASKLGLLQRNKPDWKSVVELTSALRKFDPVDPVKYDFALFGLGVLGKTGFST